MRHKKPRHLRSNLEEQQIRKLMYSVTQNDFVQVSKLVANGIPNLVNMLDSITCETPLHAAVCNGYYDMTAYLIEQGSNIRKRDKKGRTPLIRAVDKGNMKILSLLIEAGGCVNDRDPSGCHALFYGLKPSSRHLGCIEILLKEGANIDTLDGNNQTMLVHAVQNGYLDITETLIALGADVNVKNCAGEGLVYIAARANHIQLITLIIKGGAPKNEVDVEGNTAVHHCAANRNIDILRLLAFSGAELNLCNHNNDTPLHHAVRTGFPDTIKFLLSRGVPLDAANNDSLTPKSIASGHKDIPSKKLLKKQELKLKRVVMEGKISKADEYWKIVLYEWTKEHKNILIEEFFAKDVNQTGLIERSTFDKIWNSYEVPLSDYQKDEICYLHLKDDTNLIKYLDFLDGNLYLRTAAYDGFARA